MAIIKIKDENEKEFEIDLGVCFNKINDDLDSDANKFFAKDKDDTKVSQIETKIINSNGEAFNIADSENSGKIVDIDIFIEASHSDTKINNAFYTGESMLRDAESYTSPFKKPMIKNHNSHSEPIGRITNSECKDSAFVENTKCIDVTAKIKDKDAIEKILDGRYKTVSIGASPGTVVCNICGKHILKDGKFNFCGHWRGETYKDKACTWKMEDLEYEELSIVNSPADRYAQIYKIQVNTEDDLKNQNSKENVIKDSKANQILDFVPPVKEEPESIDNKDEKIKSLGDEVGKLQIKNEELEKEIIALKADNSLLDTALSSITDLYYNDMISIVNKFGKKIVDKDTEFNVLKKEISSVLDMEYKQEENVNNKGKEGTTVTVASNPGLVFNKENENKASGVIDNDKAVSDIMNSFVK